MGEKPASGGGGRRGLSLWSIRSVWFVWLNETRTYLKIEKPHSIGHRLRETQSRDRDISKDSAVCSWLFPINQSLPVLTNRF